MGSLPPRDGAISTSLPARGGGPPQPRRVPVRLGGLAALAILAFGAASPTKTHAQDHDTSPACAYPQSGYEDSIEITMHADRISLHARDVPLCAVLAAFAAETGLTVYGDVADDRRVAAQFERQRVTRVLDRLLGNGGYLLVLPDATSGAHGRIRPLRSSGAPLTDVEAPSTDAAASPRARDEATIDEKRVQRESIELAAELDEAAAVSVLASALADADAGMRELAVETLAMLDTANARELLHAALQDADPDVRLEVVDTLGDLEDLRSTLALEQALADADARVREAAAQYLAERN